MLHLIDKNNAHLYKNELLEMYQLRYRVFIEKLKWPLDTALQIETDQFDHQNSQYFIRKKDDKVVGCLRVLPNDYDIGLGTVFAQYVDDLNDLKKMKTIECSRLCKDSNYLKDFDQEIRMCLIEYCLAFEYSEFVMLAATAYGQSYKDQGFKIRWLGPEVIIDGIPCRTCSVTIESSLLEKVYKKTNNETNHLFYQSSKNNFIPIVKNNIEKAA